MTTLKSCPACRARFRGDEPFDEPCRRCGSDLSTLRRVYAFARDSRRRARRALRERDWARALTYAARARELVDEPETRETLCAALVALGRPREALSVLAR